MDPLDLVIFFGSLVAVMVIGLVAGRKEETSEDYYLAGRQIRWWGVAASIFGSNVSANHLVGFVGAGFAIGFAQSHYELGAIVGLMLLAYGFLPVYRKLNVYTLSEYLGQRFDERSRAVYAVFMILIMVVVQMVGGLYIGSRSMIRLLEGTPLEPGYATGVLLLATLAAVYTILGGLKAVIWTDILQSILLLSAAVLVALLTFSQQEVGGWIGLVQLEAAVPAAEQRLHLYLPSTHKDLPWSGVLTGLMCLHFFYWGTNQFIVQRTLAARSDSEARLGIIAAGFFKLGIPFFSIATGIAAFYMLQERLPGETIDQDVVFVELMKLTVAPLGAGLVGLIAAGLIGAILSSVDSMMNSSATIFSIDIYKRYIDPGADDRRLIAVGRLSIVAFVALAALLAIVTQDPKSKENFFLQIVDQQSHLVPGLLVAFALGMFWRGATATGAFAAILAGPICSLVIQFTYNRFLGTREAFGETLGAQLNMLHRVAVAVIVSGLVLVVVSLMTRRDPEKEKLTWVELGNHRPADLWMLLGKIAGTIVVYIVLAVGMVSANVPWLQPRHAALVAAAWTLGMFIRSARAAVASRRASGEIPADEHPAMTYLKEDRVWAGVLLSLSAFMMFYFY